jgi:hypothetical protein
MWPQITPLSDPVPQRQVATNHPWVSYSLASNRALASTKSPVPKPSAKEA